MRSWKRDKNRALLNEHESQCIYFMILFFFQDNNDFLYEDKNILLGCSETIILLTSGERAIEIEDKWLLIAFKSVLPSKQTADQQPHMRCTNRSQASSTSKLINEK